MIGSTRPMILGAVSQFLSVVLIVYALTLTYIIAGSYVRSGSQADG